MTEANEVEVVPRPGSLRSTRVTRAPRSAGRGHTLRVKARRQMGVLMCLVPLIVGACGGSGDPAPAAPAVGAEFATRASAVCQTAHDRKRAQGSFADRDFNPTKPDPAKLLAVAAFIDEGTAIYAAWLRDMQALGSPPSGQDAWTDVLAAIKAQLEQHQHQHAAALAGDTKTFVDDFHRGADAQAAMQRAAKAAGLPACATVEG